MILQKLFDMKSIIIERIDLYENFIGEIKKVIHPDFVDKDKKGYKRYQLFNEIAYSTRLIDINKLNGNLKSLMEDLDKYLQQYKKMLSEVEKAIKLNQTTNDDKHESLRNIITEICTQCIEAIFTAKHQYEYNLDRTPKLIKNSKKREYVSVCIRLKHEFGEIEKGIKLYKICMDCVTEGERIFCKLKEKRSKNPKKVEFEYLIFTFNTFATKELFVREYSIQHKFNQFYKDDVIEGVQKFAEDHFLKLKNIFIMKKLKNLVEKSGVYFNNTLNILRTYEFCDVINNHFENLINIKQHTIAAKVRSNVKDFIIFFSEQKDCIFKKLNSQIFPKLVECCNACSKQLTPKKLCLKNFLITAKWIYEGNTKKYNVRKVREIINELVDELKKEIDDKFKEINDRILISQKEIFVPIQKAMQDLALLDSEANDSTESPSLDPTESPSLDPTESPGFDSTESPSIKHKDDYENFYKVPDEPENLMLSKNRLYMQGTNKKEKKELKLKEKATANLGKGIIYQQMDDFVKESLGKIKKKIKFKDLSSILSNLCNSKPKSRGSHLIFTYTMQSEINNKLIKFVRTCQIWKPHGARKKDKTMSLCCLKNVRKFFNRILELINNYPSISKEQNLYGRLDSFDLRSGNDGRNNTNRKMDM